MTQEFLTDPIRLSSSSSSSTNISRSASINPPSSNLPARAPYLTSVHYTGTIGTVVGLNVRPQSADSMRRQDSMLSPEERELQMLRERCAYLQNVVSSSSTTTVLPIGDTLNASGNCDAVPRNPHGNSPPLPFPEIDEKGWYRTGTARIGSLPAGT
ncbi:hypothetical protein NUW54_g1037 [Trametes sanguinea]|uniref:Uncharacterized protein n=1 Tax=Trametes sanguinea TaxID=158606 RepID=A0ACC1Q981_9APHY|nr:hypothetical protein NUW54_g1037 [Trametes sanguinea]